MFNLHFSIWRISFRAGCRPGGRQLEKKEYGDGDKEEEEEECWTASEGKRRDGISDGQKREYIPPLFGT